MESEGDALVAPYAGAWIETYARVGCACTGMSPLMQGRGLKLRYWPIWYYRKESPLMQGRGLKPLVLGDKSEYPLSPLMQGRGLKPCILPAIFVFRSSPLMQGRGLKPLGGDRRALTPTSPLMQGRGLKLWRRTSNWRTCNVAPYAGAWIETTQ